MKVGHLESRKENLMGTSRSGLYLSTKGSRRKISEFALVHSNEGTFMNVKSPKPKKSPFRMKSGGHGEDNIKLLKKYGIKYNIIKTYPNGVRVGNVEGHKEPKKRNSNGQTWFPKSWTANDIQKAGEHVAALESNKHIKDGYNMYGMWKGVKVVVRKTNGKVATIFPDVKQPTKKKGKK